MLNPKCTDVVLLLSLELANDLDLKPRLDSHVLTYKGNATEVEFSEIYSVKQGPHLSQVVGHWSQDNGLEWTSQSFTQRRSNFGETQLTVASLPYAPYVTELTDNGAEGYVPEVLRAMQDKYGFQVRFVPSADGNYGGKVNGSWNGFVRMLIDGKADMVGAGFAISAARAEGMYYMTLKYKSNLSPITVGRAQEEENKKAPFINSLDMIILWPLEHFQPKMIIDSSSRFGDSYLHLLFAYTTY